MDDIDSLEATVKRAKAENDTSLIEPNDVLAVLAEVKALRIVETHARTSVGKLLLNAWGHSLAVYFDGLANALSELDFLRNKERDDEGR